MRRRNTSRGVFGLWWCICAAVIPSLAWAQGGRELPPFVEWARAGIMVGSPPPEEKIVSKANWLSYPQLSWSLQHTRELFPTRTIERGGRITEFPVALCALEGISFEAPDGRPVTFGQFLKETYTDAILVIQEGRIVYERYFNNMTPKTPHMLFSISKSFVGLLGAVLVHEGILEERAAASKYVPELEATAFGDATIRDLLDMRVGAKFSEVYTDPNSHIVAYVTAAEWVPTPPGYTGPGNLYAMMRSLKEREGPHGAAFGYKSVVSDVLAWVIRRATGKTLSELLSQRIWGKLGAEEDAFYLLDTVGTEVAMGGMNATLRDLGRFGQMMLNMGNCGGIQVVPKEVVEGIMKGGDREAFARAQFPTRRGWSYKNQWWVTHNPHGAFMAMGVHGQRLYIDPKAKMVIAKLGSHPVASNVFTDEIHMRAFMALAKELLH